MKGFRKVNWARSAAAFCLACAVLANSSMFVLASSDDKPLLGEIIVTGKSENGLPPYVIVNGERAVSGRTFSSYSMIETPAAVSADINLGAMGRVSLSPESSLILTFGEKNISGKLLTGKLRVFNAPGVSVRIETPDDVLSNNSKLSGEFTIDVVSGKTAASAEDGELFYKNGEPAGQTQTTAASGGDWIPVAVFAAIVGTAVAYVVFNQSDDEDTPTFVVSPVR